MASLLEWVEGTSIAVFVRESPSLFGYTLVLSLHAMGLAIVVGIGVVVALRLLGVARGVPLAPLLKLFPLMWGGFTVNALSGFALLAANASTMLANVMFLIKMGLIVLALVNMELLRSRIAGAAAARADPGAGPVPTPMRAIAASSLVLWAAVVVTGRLTAYPNFVRTVLGG